MDRRAPSADERLIQPTPSTDSQRVGCCRLLAAYGLAGYDADTLACFLAAIDEADSAPVFDIGANIGIFSWLAAALTPATVVAFEPTPDLSAQMRAICIANGLAVKVEELALAFWQAFAGWRTSIAEIGKEAALPRQTAVDGRVAD